MNTPQTITRSSASVGGDRAVGHAVGHGLGDRVLRRAEHLHGLLHPLDRHLGDQHRGGLGDRLGVSTASRLVCPADWLASALANAVPTGPVLLPIKQVDVGDLVALADEGLADVHHDVAGHGRLSGI